MAAVYLLRCNILIVLKLPVIFVVVSVLLQRQFHHGRGI